MTAQESEAELLANFLGGVGTAAASAPDEYEDWSYVTYQSNRELVFEDWSKLRSTRVFSPEQVIFIEMKLGEAFREFDAGRRAGRAAMWMIYNLGNRVREDD